MKTLRVEVSWNTLWQILVLVGLMLLIYIARNAIGVLFIGIVMSLGLDPAVSFLERKGVHRLLGTVLVFLLALIIFAAAMLLIVPTVIIEAGAFLTQFNEAFSQFFGFGVPEAAIQGLSTNLNEALSFLTSSNISITGAISSIFNKVVLVLATIIISFYLSIEKNGTERLLKVILPTRYEKTILRIFGKFKNKIRIWLIAQLGLSLIIGVIVTIGLWLLGVRYALTLGILAAVFELVPVIGPILSGGVALLIALPESLTLGLYVLIFFIIVQQLENNVLIPFIMSKSMRVHPIMVLIALLAGAQAAGLVGIVLAVPVALLAQEIFNYLAERKDHEAGLGI